MPTMKAVSMVTSSALPWSCLFVLIFIVYLWGLNGEFYGFRMTTLADRSEEHTSELQSRSDLVCRLLLEKKKIIICSVAPAHGRPPGEQLPSYESYSRLLMKVTRHSRTYA